MALFVVLGNALISPTTRVYSIEPSTTTTVEEDTTSTTSTTSTTIPPVVPGVPTDLFVIFMSRTSAVVSFVAPLDEGSSPITNYVIRTNSDPSTDIPIFPTISMFYSEQLSFPEGSVSFAVSAESEAGSSGWLENSFSWDNTNPQVPTVVLVDPQAESVHFPQMLMYGPTYMTICVVPDIDLKFNNVATLAGEAFAIEPDTASSVIAGLNANGGLLLAASDHYYSQKLGMPANVVISAYAVSDPNDNSTSYCNGFSGVPFFQQSVEIRPLNIGLKRRQVDVVLHRTEAALYEVGDSGPGGGTIFYVDMNRPVGSQYFEAACAGWTNNCDGTTADPTAEWGCDGVPISGADGTAIGTGEHNTANIVNIEFGCAESGIAARLANDYTNSGKSDWFLPSQDELNALCKWAFGDTVNAVCFNNNSGGLSLTGVGGFSLDYYWSSSEYDLNIAWLQAFYNGDQGLYTKYGTPGVRPVRSF